MDRHWFPAILIGLSVGLALIFAVVLTPAGQELIDLSPDVRDLNRTESQVTNETYTAAITSLLTDYQTEQNAAATYAALIAIRVPRDMLNLHYELVIALGKVVSGDNAEAEARLTALKAQHPWLPL